MEIKDIKPGLRKHKKVKYKNNDYYFIASKIRFDELEKNFIYDVELKSINTNSIIITRMDKVELVKEKSSEI